MQIRSTVIAVTASWLCTSVVSAIDFQTRNYNTIKTIYNTTIFPNNQGFIRNGTSALPKGLFNEKASGRIAPVGNFSGFEDSVEYFFGLTPPPLPPLFGTWTEAKLVSFTSGCPEVAASVVYGKTTGVNPAAPDTFGKTISTIKQVAFWRFDEKGAVLYYDAWLPTLTRYTNELYGTPPTPDWQKLEIQTICSQTQSLCTGANTQFKSVEDCVAQLTAKEYGSFDDAWGDNVVCRSLHVLLAKIRPDAHCAHVGPTGGGKCVNIDYDEVYINDDVNLFGPGSPFVCPQPTKPLPPGPAKPPGKPGPGKP